MREVTVSSVSGAPIVADPGDTDDALFDKVVRRWTDRLEVAWPDKPDLVVLPEHATRPISGRDPYENFPIERVDAFTHACADRLMAFFASLAAEHRTHLAWSGYRIDDQGLLRNSTVVYGPDGEPAGVPYDKNYPTIAEYRTRRVNPGHEMVVLDTPVGRLAPVICYDLNFTEALDRLVPLRPEIILFGSAYHGGFMEQYWAYTARSWFVGAVHAPNLSEAYSPVGERVATSTNYRHNLTTKINLDYQVCHIDEHRDAFIELKARYGSRVTIHDPGRVGVVLITSEDPDLPLSEALDSVGIVDVDDYFKRSIDVRNSAAPVIFD